MSLLSDDNRRIEEENSDHDLDYVAICYECKLYHSYNEGCEYAMALAAKEEAKMTIKGEYARALAAKEEAKMTIKESTKKPTVTQELNNAKERICKLQNAIDDLMLSNKTLIEVNDSFHSVISESEHKRRELAKQIDILTAEAIADKAIIVELNNRLTKARDAYRLMRSEYRKRAIDACESLTQAMRIMEGK